MNNNDFSAFENSIAANCLLLLEILPCGPLKCAKLRRGGFRLTESERGFARDSYNFLGGACGPGLFEYGAEKNRSLTPSPSQKQISAFVKILPAPRSLIAR